MGDLFRKEYRELSEAERNHLACMKGAAEQLNLFFGDAANHFNGDPRMLAMARANLEQSIMWAVKAVTG